MSKRLQIVSPLSSRLTIDKLKKDSTVSRNKTCFGGSSSTYALDSSFKSNHEHNKTTANFK